MSMNILRKPVSRSRREHRILVGLVSGAMFIAACGGGATEVAPQNTIAQALVSTETTTTVAPTTTTTTPPVKSCDPLPESNLLLNIETDLADEVVRPFLCGLHAAARDLGVGPSALNLALFNDKAAMKEAMGRFLPGMPFEGSQPDIGYFGFMGSDVMFWNYPMTLDYATDEAFIFRVGTHEYFHGVQASLLYGGTIEPSPSWLNEGSAEYFALEMLEDYGYTDHLERWKFGAEVFVADYATNLGTLRNWERTPFPPNLLPYVNYPTAARIAEMLVDLSSKDAVLKTYWIERKAEEPWQQTFERVFGLTVDDFYAMVDAEFS